MGERKKLPGTDFDLLFPGKYLKAADLMGKPWNGKIKWVGREEMPSPDKGAKEEAVVIEFHNSPKALICNKTNGVFLKALFGRDYSKWVDRVVTFAPVKWNGEDWAIRIIGSPEISEDVAFEGKIGFSHVKKTLIATGKAKNQTVQAEGKTVTAALPARQAEDTPT